MTTFNLQTVKISDFIANDDKGNAFVKAFGFDKNNNHVATTFGCDKDGCDCIGSWTIGFPDDVHAIVNRLDVCGDD